MSIKLPSTGPLSISSLTALPALIKPTFSFDLNNISWNDYNRVSFYTKSLLAQPLSANSINNTTSFNAGNWNTTYGLINLSSYTLNSRLSVTSNTVLNNNISLLIEQTFLDAGMGVYVNINSRKTASNILSGIQVAQIYDTGAFGSISTNPSTDVNGQHLRGPVVSIFSPLILGATLGDYIDFYIGAGPQSAPSGNFYNNTNISCEYIPVLSTIPTPTQFSYYKGQDYDIPLTPLSLSDFHSATNYDILTTNLFGLSANRFSTYQPTSAYYVYSADGSTKQYTNLVSRLSTTGGTYYLSTKKAPTTGILTTTNTTITFLNYNQPIDILFNVDNATYNTYPLCKILTVPVGSTTVNLSSYIYSLSSFCSLYVRPTSITSNSQFILQINNRPLLIFPNNLL